jgi:hypothetical protein
MGNISLEIRGLALCHFIENDGIWKVFFPRVDDHQFEIKVTRKVGSTDQNPNIFVLPPASKINFAFSSTTIKGTRNPNEWNDAIDLSGKDYHDEEIHLLSNDRLYAGVVTLNGASLISKKAEHPEELQVWDSREKQKTLIKTLTPANIFATEFQFGDEADGLIKVENKYGLGFDVALPSVANTSYTVEISNDCAGKHCGDFLDFKELYKIIDESQFKTKRRIELVALPNAPSVPKMGVPGSRCGGSGGGRIANPNVV